jgi:NADH:ubiquinone oxidoreductase subunit 2 (subunit N)
MFRWAVGFYICGFDCRKHSGIYQAWSFYLVGVFFLSLCVLECKILFIQKKKKKKTVKELVLSLKQAELSA